MFQVNREKNRLLKFEECSFSALKLREREHLQEWLAHQPDALGEELLIIQKEFDGFADTRERLDLLALDKDGQLVVIENKLDDSGRDVTWQALKYTSYVSNLTKVQIVDIYQQYLDRYTGGGNASQKICDFLQIEVLDEVVLNPGNDQRLIFIAANFRKEVTATVLWLREHQIDARCFKITPYRFGDELLINIQSVIPTPEVADFMIGMAEKETEARVTKNVQRKSQGLVKEFWEFSLEVFRQNGLTRFDGSSLERYWIKCGFGVGGVVYSAVLMRNEARVEIIIMSSDKIKNKMIFDKLADQKKEFESKFGGPLSWRRMDESNQSKILVSNQFDGYNKEVWPEIAEWISDNMIHLQAAFDGHVPELKAILKMSNTTPT